MSNVLLSFWSLGLPEAVVLTQGKHNLGMGAQAQADDL